MTIINEYLSENPDIVGHERWVFIYIDRAGMHSLSLAYESDDGIACGVCHQWLITEGLVTIIEPRTRYHERFQITDAGRKYYEKHSVPLGEW